jgi:hypothetical protein
MAGLTFRVGRADETLATAGITHLLEHLTLFHHGLSDYHYNGATGSVVTHFHMQGSEEDVVTYLVGVCAALSNLPLDRLETEKGILRTEAAGAAVLSGGSNRTISTACTRKQMRRCVTRTATRHGCRRRP